MVCRFCQVAKPLVPHRANTCPAYLRCEIGEIERDIERTISRKETHPYHPSILDNKIEYRNKLMSALTRADKRVSDARLKLTLTRQA
jgi:hypothetical protein